MSRLSKEDRRRLKRQYKEDRKNEVFPSILLSEHATFERTPPKALVDEAATLRVNLKATKANDAQWLLQPPSAPDGIYCAIVYGAVDESMTQGMLSLDDMREAAVPVALGSSCITILAQPRLHRANDFIQMTVLRVLGRLTKGTLVDFGRNFIMDDWLSWSLDYMEPDMFKVQRVYDSESPDTKSLLKEFPQLRRRRFWLF